MTAWYDFPVTNPFGLAGGEANLGGHSGVDIGTPNNTPLFFPVAGKVIAADYKYFGGEIVIQAANGLQYAFLHVNNIMASVGQSVAAGQVVATSGGGVGDKLRPGNAGQVVTATSQSDFAGSSSGYHTHFSVFTGKSLSDYWNSLDGNVNRIDPSATVQAMRAGHLAPSYPSGTATLADTTGASGAASAAASMLGLPTPAQLQRAGLGIGFFILAIVFCLVGFYLLFSHQINTAAVTGAKAAGKAALLA